MTIVSLLESFRTSFLALGFDGPTLLMFGAGLLGGFARSCATAAARNQTLWSQQTLADLIVSGMAGVLILASGFMPISWSPAWQAAVVAVTTYTTADAASALVKRFNWLPQPENRRADDAKP
jgi:hypothetical protein